MRGIYEIHIFVLRNKHFKQMKDHRNNITAIVFYLLKMESNDKSDDRRLMFGGDRLKANTNPNTAFGQVASAVVRMCMLVTVNVKPRRLWPEMRTSPKRRNREKLNQEIFIQPTFCLANSNKEVARRYWSKYDQLYPHFVIEQSQGGLHQYASKYAKYDAYL